MKIQQAVNRLNSVLSKKKNLEALDKPSAKIYHAVLTGFYKMGRAMFLYELLALNKQAREVIELLAEQDILTFDDTGNILGCYPFTMENRVHQIQLNGFEVHAMCALDALAPSAMFECPSVVTSECAITKTPVKIKLRNQSVLNSDEVSELHFGINWVAESTSGNCSNTLCTEMIFLSGERMAEEWLNHDTANREIFTLPLAIEFASDVFKPRMLVGKGL